MSYPIHKGTLEIFFWPRMFVCLLMEFVLKNQLCLMVTCAFLLKKQWSKLSDWTLFKPVKRQYLWPYSSEKDGKSQGTNARKDISEVYTFFVLQSTVFVRKSKHKTDVTAWHGIDFHKNNLWNILFIGKFYVNYQNYQNSMLLTFSETKRTLIHLFLFKNYAERELVSICTWPQLTFLALVPWRITWNCLNHNPKTTFKESQRNWIIPNRLKICWFEF